MTPNTLNTNEVLIANSILTTALLANEVCIQTKGEFILQEEDYIYVVKNFQTELTRKIVPIKTQSELKEEARKYITEILKKLSSEESNDSGANSTESKSSSDNIGKDE